MRKIRRSTEEYRRWLRYREERGLSWPEVAAKSGIPLSTLYQWRRRLNRGRGRRRDGFRKVEVVSEPQLLGELELELPGGVRIRVPSNFDSEHLRRVVACLAGGC